MSWWMYLIIGIVSLLVLMVVYAYLQFRKFRHVKTSPYIVNLHEKNFNSFIRQHRIVVIDFWAEWCMPCKVLQPILNQLAEKYHGQVGFAKLNVDTNKRIAAQFGIQNIPTVIFLLKGKEIKREIGVKTLSYYQKILNTMLHQ